MLCGEGCAQGEHNFGESNTGAEKDKLKVRFLDVGEQAGHFLDFLHLRLDELPGKSRVANRGAQEGDPRFSNFGNTPIKGVIDTDLGERAPHLGFGVDAGERSGKVEAPGRAFLDQ